MPTLSETQQAQVRLVLGYASMSATSVLGNRLAEQRDQTVIDQTVALLAELASIDTQMNDARADSMAQGVGNLKLDYRQHVAHLKSEGSRKLGEMSNVLGIGIHFNKYAPPKKAVSSYW